MSLPLLVRKRLVSLLGGATYAAKVAEWNANNATIPVVVFAAVIETDRATTTGLYPVAFVQDTQQFSHEEETGAHRYDNAMLTVTIVDRAPDSTLAVNDRIRGMAECVRDLVDDPYNGLRDVASTPQRPASAYTTNIEFGTEQTNENGMFVNVARLEIRTRGEISIGTVGK